MTDTADQQSVFRIRINECSYETPILGDYRYFLSKTQNRFRYSSPPNYLSIVKHVSPPYKGLPVNTGTVPVTITV
jgi:hypothetical protein